MKRKFTKLIAAIALLVFMTPTMAGWGQSVSVNDVLWTEPFKGNPSSSTTFSETTSWGDYLNPTTFVTSDASSLSYTTSNAMANSGSATNMNGAHVWLNKSVDSYFQVAGIPLYNTTKVKVSWAQATSGSSTTVYYQFDGTGSFQSLSTCSGPNENFVSDELSVANHTTIALKFFHPNTNSKNTRIDNLTLTAIEVESGGGSNNPVITITQPTGGTIAVSDNNTNVPSGTSVAAETVLTLSNTPEDAYTFGSYSVYKTDDPSTTVEVTNGTFTMPAYNVTVTGTFNAKHTHTINLTQPTTGGTISTNPSGSAYEGQTVTISASPSDNFKFTSWTIEGASLENANSPTTTFVMGTTDVTATTSLVAFDGTVDVLDKEFTGVGSSYEGWSNKAGSASSAVYAGNSAGGNSSIQLRSSDNSGIISTSFGGRIRKVAVTWNNNTASGRTLDVYGKNTPYTATSDLYGNASQQGTKIGSIVCGTSTELVIADGINYKYIGLRSKSGAMYLSEIRINWETVTTYNVEIDNSIQNGSVESSVPSAEEGETVTLTATPNEHYYFNSDTWYVLDGSANEVEVTVDPNNANKATITMPASNVLVSASFAQKTYTITYCVNGNSHLIPAAQVLGGNSIGTFPTDPVYGNNDFLGWSSTEGGTNYVATSYVPTDDMTLYAVFGTTGEVELTITGNTTGIPTSYGSGTWTIDSKQFYQSQVLYQNPYSNPVIQFKKSEGFFYNKTDFGAITSIVLTYYSTDRAISVKAGTSENPTSADAIEAYVDDETPDVYVYALPENCHYFLLSNGDGTSQVSSIDIYYKNLVPASITVTRIDDVTELSGLEENEIIVVENGGELTFTGTNADPANLIVEDGGQLYTENTNVNATVQKNVDGAGADNWAATSGADGWYFIASPVNGAAFPTGSNADQDIYKLDWANIKWLNLQISANSSLLSGGFQRGTGYLYASNADKTLIVAGEIQPLSNDNNATVTLANDGWNLIGNPLTCKVTVSTAFSALNNASSVANMDANSTIDPFQGIAVWGNANDEVTFTKAATQNAATPGNSALQMTVAQNIVTRGNTTSTTVDNAVVSFNEGSVLPKFTMLEGNANLYIPQNGEEFSIVSSNGQGTMPVNFRANENGQYTLTVNPENVEMNYLHLIDNMTGTDIDLLAEPSYTFTAKVTDYESRFKLVFASAIENADNDNETFAFFANGQLIVSNEGEATLQVIDMLGRIVSNQTVNGSVSKTINQPAGIYMIRLINGNDVKVQKMIVR